MNVPLTVVTRAGSVALLLWGVRMVQTGVQRAFGARLRSTLGQALNRSASRPAPPNAEILVFATNMEQAADIVEKDLLGIVSRKIKRGLAFSESGQADLMQMLDRLSDNVRTAASLFMTGDERAARFLAGEKEIFRNLETAATEAHFERLRSGRIDTAETGALHLDALRHLKDVNAHLVAGAAYPVLESKGELLASRLRQET